MTIPATYFFFQTGQFIYIGKVIDTSVHGHHAIQIALNFDSPFHITIPGQTSLQSTGVIIDSDQPHECQTSDNVFLFLNIDPETNIGKALKKLYLHNRSIAELLTSRQQMSIVILGTWR